MSEKANEINNNIGIKNLPREILAKILNKLTAKEQFTARAVNQNFQAFFQTLPKPSAEFVKRSFPDEVKFRELLSKQNTFLEFEYQRLYEKFSNKPFYVYGFINDHPRRDILSFGLPSFHNTYPVDFESEKLILQKVFKSVKTDDWENLPKLSNERLLFYFTIYCDYKGRTALDWAHQLNCEKILNELYKLFSNQKNPFYKIMCGKLTSEEVSALDLNALKDSYLVVIRYGTPELIQTWLKALTTKNNDGLNVLTFNQNRGWGYLLHTSVLRFSAQWGRLDSFKTLFDHVNATIKNEKELIKALNSSLIEAVYNGHYDIVKYILDLKKGADINLSTVHKNSLLHSAAFKGHYEMVYLLIQQGAAYTRNKKNNYPFTNLLKQNSKIPRELYQLHRQTLIKHNPKMPAILAELNEVLLQADAQSKTSIKETALRLYKWYKDQSKISFADHHQGYSLRFHNFHSKPWAVEMINKIKVLENFTQYEFEKMIDEYRQTDDHVGYFEGIQYMIVQAFEKQKSSTVADFVVIPRLDRGIY